MSIEIIGLRFTHRKSINPSLYGPFFNYFGGGILRYYLQLILTYIIVSAVTDAQEKRAKQNQYKPKSYKEVFTPEEAKKMDIGGHIDGPGDWKPDPNAAKRTKEFIEKGGNADPVGDAIQDGDYHDLLDQNGGPEGFWQ